MPNNNPENKRVLVVSDNEPLIQLFDELIEDMPEVTADTTFDFACAPWDGVLVGKKIGAFTIGAIDVKKDYESILGNYDLVISAHSKQLFPEQLTNGVPCINVHPGLNPHNRGWYPQVFSIINGLPLGATIHVIDEEIDHGAIIDQEVVDVNAWDTSSDVYNRVISAEEIILRRSLRSILDGSYTAQPPVSEGNINFKKDFEALREIDLSSTATYGEVINRLRALTHGSFKNAYFIDEQSGRKVFISVQLEVEDE